MRKVLAIATCAAFFGAGYLTSSHLNAASIVLREGGLIRNADLSNVTVYSDHPSVISDVNTH